MLRLNIYWHYEIEFSYFILKKWYSKLSCWAFYSLSRWLGSVGGAKTPWFLGFVIREEPSTAIASTRITDASQKPYKSPPPLSVFTLPWPDKRWGARIVNTTNAQDWTRRILDLNVCSIPTLWPARQWTSHTHVLTTPCSGNVRELSLRVVFGSRIVVFRIVVEYGLRDTAISPSINCTTNMPAYGREVCAKTLEHQN